jgi:hypothetical protein
VDSPNAAVRREFAHGDPNLFWQKRDDSFSQSHCVAITKDYGTTNSPPTHLRTREGHATRAHEGQQTYPSVFQRRRRDRLCLRELQHGFGRQRRAGNDQEPCLSMSFLRTLQRHRPREITLKFQRKNRFATGDLTRFTGDRGKAVGMLNPNGRPVRVDLGSAGATESKTL